MVDITAFEKVGETSVQPYCQAEIERKARLDRGLESVLSREVASVQLTFGFTEKKVIQFPPRHLDGLISLLVDVRRRIDDGKTQSEELLS